MLFRSNKATLRSKSLANVDQSEVVASENGLSVSASVRKDRRKNRSNNSRSRSNTGDSTDLNAIWNELMSMKSVVEAEHDRKLRRIESDLRWTMTLVGGQFLTIIGAAVAMLAGG